MEDLNRLRDELLAEVGQAADLEALDRARVAALGKKGRITELMKQLGGLDPDARRQAGQDLNLVKDAVAEAIEARKAGLADAALNTRLAAERIDVSLPPRPEQRGYIHPISQVMDELTAIFAAHRLPPPNLVCQCQSALSIMTILVNSDILAMVPIQWVSSPVLRGWLDAIDLEETFAAPPIMLIHRAGIGLTPAAEYFTHLVTQASKLHADAA